MSIPRGALLRIACTLKPMTRAGATPNALHTSHWPRGIRTGCRQNVHKLIPLSSYPSGSRRRRSRDWRGRLSARAERRCVLPCSRVLELHQNRAHARGVARLARLLLQVDHSAHLGGWWVGGWVGGGVRARVRVRVRVRLASARRPHSPPPPTRAAPTPPPTARPRCPAPPTSRRSRSAARSRRAPRAACRGPGRGPG